MSVGQRKGNKIVLIVVWGFHLLCELLTLADLLISLSREIDGPERDSKGIKAEVIIPPASDAADPDPPELLLTFMLKELLCNEVDTCLLVPDALRLRKEEGEAARSLSRSRKL